MSFGSLIRHAFHRTHQKECVPLIRPHHNRVDLRYHDRWCPVAFHSRLRSNQEAIGFHQKLTIRSHWSPKEIRIRILNYDSVRIGRHEDSVIFSTRSICYGTQFASILKTHTGAKTKFLSRNYHNLMFEKCECCEK